MRVIGINWVGIRAEDMATSQRLFEGALGLRRVHQAHDFLVFDTARGDRVELFGSKGPQPLYQFERNSLVVGFLVDDMAAAKAAVMAAGFSLLGPTQGDAHSQWQHFRGPGGRVYELGYDAAQVAAFGGPQHD
jgi:catechol 2,3-dioxygenase-like lactoylglutathione lyase family enzyme